RDGRVNGAEGRVRHYEGNVESQNLEYPNRQGMHCILVDPAATDREDLQLDDRGRGRLLQRDFQRMGDLASTAGNSSWLDRRANNVDPARLGERLHRYWGVQRPGSGTRAQPALDGT